MNKIAMICLLFFSFSWSALAQQDKETVEITGLVTDQKKEPLVGVNVYVAEVPGLGTVTDADGKYKLRVPKYHRLSFSYIGYDKFEILIKDQHVVDVTLKESANSVLDEVVVTGTGAQKKVSVTGAITTVDVKELQNSSASSVSNTLAGNVAGILSWTTSGQPGKNTSEFWIRGISTFGAGSSAYILVDGFERDLDDLNIEDIESFTVLKDASATAIYGSKGANGVVLITTKRGKEGRVNIDVKVESTYNTRTITPEFINGTTYANMMNEALVTRNQEAAYDPEELEILRLGLDPDLYPNVDWADLILKDGAMGYRANLNISGGGSTARYYVSGSYLNEGGMYKTDETLNDYDTNANYKRWNYRLNTDMNITKTTVLKVGVSGVLSKRNSPGLGDADLWGSLFGYSPISTPIVYSNGYVPAYGTGNQTNPWVMATQTGYNENWINQIQTNLSLEQKLDFITKGLRFTGRFGYDTNNSNTIKRTKWPEQWKAERARDSNGNIVYTLISSASAMTQSSSSSGDRREFLDLTFNYDRALDEHHLSSTLKYTQDAYIQTQNLGTDIKTGVSERNQGLAGRVAYNWKLRYFADFNFGYTGSENFAAGHRFGFFPAYSFAWNLGEERYVKNNMKWINMFKIRYSHGKVGNDEMDDRFPYLYTIGTGLDGYQWADYSYDNSYEGINFTQEASTEVTWEIATKNDLGLDISLFGDKLSGTIDYFKEKREGIYMERAYLPAMVGLESNPSANVGAVRSEGFDGNFAYKHKLGPIDMTVRGNMTYSKNTILEKDEANNVYPYQMETGYRVNQTRGLIALGLFKDYDDIRNSPTQTFGEYQPGDIKYKDVNGDGIIDSGDNGPIGATRQPNLVYGLGASVKWKGMEFNILFQGAGKSTFVMSGKSVYAFNEGKWGVPLKGLVEDRWISSDISGDPSTENPNASYPRLSYGGNANNYRGSTFWMRNGSYLRLKTIDLAYTIPKKIVNKFYSNNLRIYLRGTNLLTWSKFKLWDPELGILNGEEYPLTKSVTLGLTMNF